jgi:hypothetical protein
MAQRCPTAKIAGAAMMRNWRLMFRGGRTSAVATVERFPGGSVPVLVWELRPQDEEALDRYEGWPYLYRKETVRVRLDGRTVSAMIYIMNEDGHPYGLPGAYYFHTIREGYLSAGFSTDILRKAARDSKVKGGDGA